MTSRSKRVLQSETLNLINQNNYCEVIVHFSFVQPCILMKLCYLIPYFLIFGYLLRTPDNSNFFRFPLKVRVIGSRLRFFFVSLFLHAALFPRSFFRFPLKVRVIGSLKKIAESKVKNSFYSTVNILTHLIVEVSSEN